MSDLVNICNHIQGRISSLKSLLDLSLIELPQIKIRKLGEELFALESHLEDFENCVSQKEEHLKHLKELEQLSLKDLGDAEHLRDNVPPHMPSKCPVSGKEPVPNQTVAHVQPAEEEESRKAAKSFVKAMEFITVEEFQSIPQYMKGRVSYDQVNAAVNCINTALTAKYRILHQPVKALNNLARKQRQRFKEQETKDTKGQHFFVEDDIRDFTQTKVDKRFLGIVNMLRHCQRLREQRGGGITRLMLL